MSPNPPRLRKPLRMVSSRYYIRFCVYGRAKTALVASVALRAPTPLEPVGGQTVILDEVWCHRGHRGRGYVSSLLKMAQAHALDEGWAISCRPVAHDGGRDQAALEAFYLKREFELYAPGQLICYPF